jgi:hypothetical protein
MAGIRLQPQEMKSKPKRQRKHHKKAYPAVKLMTASGKLRYASLIRQSRDKNKAYKDPDASFWADWKPFRKVGVYANERAASYTHNGITRYM